MFNDTHNAANGTTEGTMYENQTTNPNELPDAGDIMIVDKDAGMIVYGVAGYALGHIVDGDSEAEQFILANVDGADLELTKVWMFVEHDGQRDFWAHEFEVDLDPDGRETAGCNRYHELHDEGLI